MFEINGIVYASEFKNDVISFSLLQICSRRKPLL